MEKIYGLPYGYELVTQNTFQSNECFAIFGQFHNGGSKKTNTDPTKNPNNSKDPNPFKNPNP